LDEASAYLAILAKISAVPFTRNPAAGRTQDRVSPQRWTALNGGCQFHMRRIRAVAVRASATMLMTLA
jgi:hypothetical protein